MPKPGIHFAVEPNLDFSLEKGDAVKKWIKKILKQEGKTAGNISFVFCTDDYLLKINRRFLGHDFYTDIITFNYSENKKTEGEIFISIERVKENALKFKQPFTKEVKRVVVHGILHLCGYKDKTPAEKKRMRAKEDEALGLME